MKKLSLLIMPLMTIPFLFSCNSSNKYDDGCPYLTFNALEDSGVVYKIEDPDDDVKVDVDIQYSTDQKTWNRWEAGHAVEIKKNNKIYIKNTKQHLSVGLDNYVYFVLSGKIAASGQISSLTSADKIGEYEYYHLFGNCNCLVRAPTLPATELANYCYSSMFSYCTNLKVAPELPATQLTSSCYADMFSECTNLEVAPKLPATQLVSDCYSTMFSGCTNLKVAPELPATQLAELCYNCMFDCCTNLEVAPKLPATRLTYHCYTYMFSGCTNLEVAPDLPATQLAESCYEGMFSDCTNLKVAPKLPATKTQLKDYCYYGMFSNCFALQKLEVGFGPDWPTDETRGFTSNWLYNAGICVKTPTFIWKGDAKITPRDGDHVPNNWTIKHAD